MDLVARLDSEFGTFSWTQEPRRNWLCLGPLEPFLQNTNTDTGSHRPQLCAGRPEPKCCDPGRQHKNEVFPLEKAHETLGADSSRSSRGTRFHPVN